MPYRLGARLLAPVILAILASATPARAQTVDPAIDLNEALRRAAAYDPATPATAARIAAANAALRQAGVRPNPTLGVDLENFAGTGDRSLLDQSEATLYYQQTVERGGKRQARSSLAQADIEIARRRGAVRALDLMARVETAWVEAMSAQAVVPLAQDRVAAAERLQTEVARRVAAARDPLFSGERAKVGVAQARIERDQAVETARQARATLAAFWGGGAQFALDSSPLARTELTDPGPVWQTPDEALLAAERDSAAMRVRLEQSRALQDPSWRAGLRHFGDGNDVALIVGGSIPLGRYDTNRGNIERAQAERTASEADIAAARIEREREASRILARQASAAAEVRRIESEVLPGAQRAVDMVRDGFNRGGGAFTFLEVAQAQEAVTAARARRIDLLKSFHLDGARLNRLTGRYATLIAGSETR